MNKIQEEASRWINGSHLNYLTNIADFEEKDVKFFEDKLKAIFKDPKLKANLDMRMDSYKNSNSKQAKEYKYLYDAIFSDETKEKKETISMEEVKKEFENILKQSYNLPFDNTTKVIDKNNGLFLITLEKDWEEIWTLTVKAQKNKWTMSFENSNASIPWSIIRINGTDYMIENNSIKRRHLEMNGKRLDINNEIYSKKIEKKKTEEVKTKSETKIVEETKIEVEEKKEVEKKTETIITTEEIQDNTPESLTLISENLKKATDIVLSSNDFNTTVVNELISRYKSWSPELIKLQEYKKVCESIWEAKTILNNEYDKDKTSSMIKDLKEVWKDKEKKLTSSQKDVVQSYIWVLVWFEDKENFYQNVTWEKFMQKYNTSQKVESLHYILEAIDVKYTRLRKKIYDKIREYWSKIESTPSETFNINTYWSSESAKSTYLLVYSLTQDKWFDKAQAISLKSDITSNSNIGTELQNKAKNDIDTFITLCENIDKAKNILSQKYEKWTTENLITSMQSIYDTLDNSLQKKHFGEYIIKVEQYWKEDSWLYWSINSANAYLPDYPEKTSQSVKYLLLDLPLEYTFLRSECKKKITNPRYFKYQDKL